MRRRLIGKVFLVLSFALLSLLWSSPEVQAHELDKLFEQVSQSVVVIHTKRVKKKAYTLKKEKLVTEKRFGSGVLISETGLILTAAHVVHIEDKIMVEFLSGEKIPARVVISTPWADISLLQLERLPASIKPVNLGDSDKVKVGEQIFVIGTPYGLEHTFTSGYISGRHSKKTNKKLQFDGEFFQTDAAINQGNSGGPMFNLQGEVVGIVSYIMSRSGGFEGIGFAVTSNMAKKLITENRFWSGLEGFMLSGRLAQIFNLPQEEGLLVQLIAENSLASRLGIKPSTLLVNIGEEEFMVGGDIILEVQGTMVSSNPGMFAKLQNLLNSLRPGDTIAMKVLRAGKVTTLSTIIID